MPKAQNYQIYALLWVSHESKQEINQVLQNECKIPAQFIEQNPHLTVYHGKRLLPKLESCSRLVRIIGDSLETRFMVFVPGGENPRLGIQPSMKSVGIRLTKRNCAIDAIQKLRSEIYQFETKEVIGNRQPTSAWKNCFGARNYQPHIKLIRPGSPIDDNLTKLGKVFRSNIDQILFDRLEVKCNWT